MGRCRERCSQLRYRITRRCRQSTGHRCMWSTSPGRIRGGCTFHPDPSPFPRCSRVAESWCCRRFHGLRRSHFQGDGRRNPHSSSGRWPHSFCGCKLRQTCTYCGNCSWSTREGSAAAYPFGTPGRWLDHYHRISSSRSRHRRPLCSQRKARFSGTCTWCTWPRRTRRSSASPNWCRSYSARK